MSPSASKWQPVSSLVCRWATTQNLGGHLRGKHLEVSQAIDLFRTYQTDHWKRLSTDTGNDNSNAKSETWRCRGRTNSKGKLKRKASRSLSSGKLACMSAEKTHELSLLLILALAVSQVPLTFLKNRYFRQFVSTLNPNYKVPGLGTIQKVLDDYVARKTKQVRAVLENVNFGSLTADTWTGKGSRKILGSTFHYTDESFKLRSLVLGVESLEKAQTSDNLRESMGK